MVADAAHQIVDVGKRFRYVAQLHGQTVLLRRATETLLEHLDVTHQLYRLIIADVIDAKRCAAGGRVGRIAAPRRIRLRYALGGADYALGNVLDVGEVAPVVGAV